MAATSTTSALAATSAPVADEPVGVRLDIHDASRLEWTAVVPLASGCKRSYSIEVEIEVPANVFTVHSPWEHVQAWARFDGTATSMRAGEMPTLDGLRRGALGVVEQVARASRGFSRHCRMASSLTVMSAREDLAEGLVLWLAAAVRVTDTGRAQLTATAPGDGTDVARERVLVDEFISMRLLEMLATTERSLENLRASRFASAYAATVDEVTARISEAIQTEIAHRRARGYVFTDSNDSNTVERYLERSSLLKKHFQEVLFLEAETFQVVERLHHWVAALVALVASTWAFAWQLALLREPSTTGVGSSLIAFALLAGVVYATKDRLKEWGRAWISGHVHRFYAQRVARWRAPPQRLSSRPVIVRARESFDKAEISRPDPLNPECRAQFDATVIRFRHRGEVLPASSTIAGVTRIKHVFRYDLSPLFARLDDTRRRVPVVDAATQRTHFAESPRVYRVPVRIRAAMGNSVSEQRGTLVIHKRGLERLDIDATDALEFAEEEPILS